MFDISEFSAQVNAVGGIAKSSKFSMFISAPPWTQSTSEVRLMQFMGDSSQLPGLTFATNDVKNLGYGPTFKLPHTPIYSDIDATFLCDQNGYVVEFFHKWMQNIININSNGNPEYSILRLPVTFTYKTWTCSTFNSNDQNLYNSVSSFNPFAYTESGSLYDVNTYQYLTFGDILSDTINSLANGINYGKSIVNLFK